MHAASGKDRLFRGLKQYVALVQGYFEKTLPLLPDRKFCFVHTELRYAQLVSLLPEFFSSGCSRRNYFAGRIQRSFLARLQPRRRQFPGQQARTVTRNFDGQLLECFVQKSKWISTRASGPSRRMLVRNVAAPGTFLRRGIPVSVPSRNQACRDARPAAMSSSCHWPLKKKASGEDRMQIIRIDSNA